MSIPETRNAFEQRSEMYVAPHGLGLALKLANLDAVRAAWPDARRIHTWNAGENDAMWRVNEALGFETAGAEALWQKVP